MNIEDLYKRGTVNANTYDFASISEDEKNSAWVQTTLSAIVDKVVRDNGEWCYFIENRNGVVKRRKLPVDGLYYRYHYKKP